MPPSAKRITLVAAVNLILLAVGVSVVEFAARWRVEGSFRGAWRSLFSSTPFSDLGTGNWMVADPELGYRWNPAQPGINTLGIRNSGITVPKPVGTFRVIVLGDSVAAPPDGFVHILGQNLGTRAEVINAAVPGYTTYQERLLLDRHLLAAQPDLVILQYCLNDNHQFLHRFDAQGRMLMTEEAERALLAPGQGILTYLARHSYILARLQLARLQRKSAAEDVPWENRPDVSVAWKDEPWNAFAGHLRAMAARSRVAVVMAPLRPQFDPRVLARGEAWVLKPQSKMAEICAAQGVPLLDLYPALARSGGKDLFYDDYHFTPAGHQAAAAALLPFLERNNLIKSQQ